MISAPQVVGGLDLAPIEEKKDRAKRDIIIYQGPEENLVSSRVGVVREMENEVLEKILDQWEDLPSTPKNAFKVSRSLDIDMEREVSLSPNPRKKYVREPSLASPVETRRSCKPYVGIVARRGRRTKKQSKEEESKRSVVNGSQRTLQEFSKNGK